MSDNPWRTFDPRKDGRPIDWLKGLEKNTQGVDLSRISMKNEAQFVCDITTGLYAFFAGLGQKEADWPLLLLLVLRDTPISPEQATLFRRYVKNVFFTTPCADGETVSQARERITEAMEGFSVGAVRARVDKYGQSVWDVEARRGGLLLAEKLHTATIVEWDDTETRVVLDDKGDRVGPFEWARASVFDLVKALDREADKDESPVLDDINSALVDSITGDDDPRTVIRSVMKEVVKTLRNYNRPDLAEVCAAYPGAAFLALCNNYGAKDAFEPERFKAICEGVSAEDHERLETAKARMKRGTKRGREEEEEADKTDDGGELPTETDEQPPPAKRAKNDGVAIHDKPDEETVDAAATFLGVLSNMDERTADGVQDALGTLPRDDKSTIESFAGEVIATLDEEGKEDEEDEEGDEDEEDEEGEEDEEALKQKEVLGEFCSKHPYAVYALLANHFDGYVEDLCDDEDYGNVVNGAHTAYMSMAISKYGPALVEKAKARLKERDAGADGVSA
jgi:hypothetical protein